MVSTTLCYIQQGDKVLMLHRVKKKNDLNKDKWIGIGGHIEENESPDECMMREAMEETGLTLKNLKIRGVITFINSLYEGEYMYLFSCDDFDGELKECDEGNLEWIKRDELMNLPMWEGDKIFLNLLWTESPFFLLTLRYEGENLIEAVLNGEKIK